MVAKTVTCWLAGDQSTRSLNRLKMSAKKVRTMSPSIANPKGKPCT